MQSNSIDAFSDATVRWPSRRCRPELALGSIAGVLLLGLLAPLCADAGSEEQHTRGSERASHIEGRSAGEDEAKDAAGAVPSEDQEHHGLDEEGTTGPDSVDRSDAMPSQTIQRGSDRGPEGRGRDRDPHGEAINRALDRY